MHYLLSIFLLLLAPMTLFDFTTEADISRWRIQDDRVMGGRSNGNFMVTEAGHGRYFGYVSLENNGGFSSVRYYMPAPIDVSDNTTIKLRLKGDGNRYQLRLKSERGQYQSYIQYFDTSGEWETIELNLADHYPSFRGRKLNIPNFPVEELAEIGILIGNKEEQEFELLIDWVKLD